MNENIIKLENLKKSYFLENWVEIPVLNWINLEIKKNEFVAIMWESWCWKSTLLNIIWFLHPLTSWKYFFDSDDISQIKDNDILAFIRNRKIWFIFQQFYLLPKLTSIENITLPSIYAWTSFKNRQKVWLELLKKVWLSHKSEAYPWELSGWEQQRIAIARALINSPDILLADEPTWNLDSKNTQEIIKLITELKTQWKTIIMVTHTKEVALYADRIVFLKDWKVLDDNYKLK